MRSFHLFGAVLFAVLGAVPRTAWACGGCFHEPPPPSPINVQSSTLDTVVTGHRMVFAVSPDRTVLWDQIKFSGEPSEFGWVLPIRPGATIEASTDAWFEALEAFTATQVISPNVTCQYPNYGFGGPFGSGSRGCGCGSDDSATALSAAADAGNGSLGINGMMPPVTVVHEGTVGAYETVTLHSNDGSALRGWLSSHNYVVPPEIEPVIDTYVSEGADFIALRLIPGKGVNQMTPVRVVTPGGSPILPLRMVAAGTGDFVDIVLYVVGEGRYGLKDLSEVFVDWKSLSFDFTANDSNYEKLRQQALDQNNGFSYLTTYSDPDPFGSKGFSTEIAGQSISDLAAAYFTQAAANDHGGGGICQGMSFGSPDLVVAGGPARNAFDAGTAAVRPDGGPRDGGSRRADGGPPKGGADGSAAADGGPTAAIDGGAHSGKPDGGSATGKADAGKRAAQTDSGAPVVEPPAGAIFSSDFTCHGYSDISAALIGMHPDRVWLSRLEMTLPHEALNMDCNVGLEAALSGVSNRPLATKFTGNPCPPGTQAAEMVSPPASSAALFRWAVGSFVAVGMARRKRRRA